jgi:hypothetical protein
MCPMHTWSTNFVFSIGHSNIVGYNEYYHKIMVLTSTINNIPSQHFITFVVMPIAKGQHR